MYFGRTLLGIPFGLPTVGILIAPFKQAFSTARNPLEKALKQARNPL